MKIAITVSYTHLDVYKRQTFLTIELPTLDKCLYLTGILGETKEKAGRFNKVAMGIFEIIPLLSLIHI